MSILVSIVVPIYNAEAYINEGLSCLLAQTYQNIEIICVDNNSKDKSLELLKEWENKSNKIKVLQEFRKGAPFARNAGTEVAKGEWIQYFDIDDYLYPDKIEYQVNLIENSVKEVDIVFEGWQVIDLKGQERKFKIENDAWKALYNGRIGNTNSVLIKKRKLNEVGNWDVNLKSSQERDLFFRILKTKPHYILSENYGSIFQMHQNSITTSTSNIEGNTIRFVELRSRIIDYLKENYLEYFNQNKEWYLGLFLERIRWIYQYDQNRSMELYNKYCKGNKVRQVGTLSKRYLTLLSIVGFPITEKIYAMFNKRFE